jgi:hypothetical protein
MTIKALYPNVRPSLDLNFARTRALDPRITYTRASTGTFVGSDGFIKNAANGAARFDHDPITGESLGLLVEEARTNNIRQSIVRPDSGGAYTFWTEQNGTITANAAVAPDGTLTAALVNSPAGAAQRNVIARYEVSLANVSGLCESIWVRAASGSVRIGLVGSSTGADQITYFTVGAQWTRISVLKPTKANYFLTLYSEAATEISFYAWGGQAETGSFPTSYIPTSGATVTRAADVASVPTTGWIDATGGTILAEYYKRIAIQGSGNYIWSLGDGNPMIMDGWKAELDFAAGIMNTTGPVIAGKNKIIFKFEQGNYAISANGSAVSTSTLGNAWSSAPSSLRIATGSAVPFGAKGLHAPIARLTYWPTRLPDAQLIALTQ